MQASLFADYEPKAARPKPRRKTAAQRQREREEAFMEFDQANGHVFEALKAMALDLRRAGHTKWGLRNLLEKARYDLALKTTESAPKINNDFGPMYARKLMAEVPELRGFFNLRER